MVNRVMQWHKNILKNKSYFPLLPRYYLPTISKTLQFSQENMSHIFTPSINLLDK